MKALALFFSIIPLNTLFQIRSADIPKSYNPHQVIITEIMADPTPQIQLPDAEYLEIYNTGTTLVDLTGWKLYVGNYERILPGDSIEPGGYRIIMDIKSDSLFAVFGKTLPVNKMPPILNSGQVITLKDAKGTVIHSVTFTEDWYKGSDKASGGWSLEIIDPENPCGGFENWSASVDKRGGTPGSKNASSGKNPDTRSPALLRATLQGDSLVLLHFSEFMDFNSLLSCQEYSVNKGFYHPSAVYPVEPGFNTVRLKYPMRFMPEVHYTLTILNSLKDCVGNRLADNAIADFAISEPPESLDVVILFKPQAGFSEFIELYNRSEKVVDLSAFSLKLGDSHTGSTKKSVILKNNPYILFPGCYVAITGNARNLLLNSYSKNLSTVIEQVDLFSFPDDGGLSDTGTQIIDELPYSPLMHDRLISDQAGVSLERIFADNPTDDFENWHSASTSSGYATPGYRNSQSVIPGDTWSITVTPEVCSPDDDGTDDVVTIHLKLNEPGWKVTLSVFDVNGRKIINLAKNYLLGTDEYFEWDGKWANEEQAEMGPYIICGEIFNHAGKTENFKKVISLVRRL
jgi:hypothetical protein